MPEDKTIHLDPLQLIPSVMQEILEDYDSSQLALTYPTKNTSTVVTSQDDIAWITEVNFPDEGGIYTKFSNFEESFKGFPYVEQVQKLDDLKKIIKSTIRETAKIFNRVNKFKLFLLMFVLRKKIKDILYVLLSSFSDRAFQLRIKEKYCCNVVREVLRVFKILTKENTEKEDLLNGVLAKITEEERNNYKKAIGGYTIGDKENTPGVEKAVRLWKDADATRQNWIVKTKQVLCNLLELDNAYKYRFQDIVPEIDKDKIRAKRPSQLKRTFNCVRFLITKKPRFSEPIMELWRVLTLMKERDGPEMEGRPGWMINTNPGTGDILFKNDLPRQKDYIVVRFAICFLMEYSDELFNLFKSFILEIDYDKIRFMKDDICYLEGRTDYDFAVIKKVKKELETLKKIKQLMDFSKRREELQRQFAEAQKAIDDGTLKIREIQGRFAEIDTIEKNLNEEKAKAKEELEKKVEA